MLSLNFSDLYKVFSQSHLHGISQTELKIWHTKFEQYRDLILSRQQGFLNLPEDEKGADKIIDFCKKTQGKYKQIVILAIGGSMLGVQTILDALSFQTKIQIFTLDNIDPFVIAQVESQLNLKNTLFLVQTKSGTTPETLSQYFYFRKKCEDQNLEIAEHFAFVTDPEKGFLRKVANEENIPCFDLAENVGGRFSVLSAIGLLIAGLVGLDVKALLAGAASAKQQYFESSADIFSLAVAQYLLYQKNKNITVLMPYSSRLKTFSNWYVQLLSESIGKELDLEGNKVEVGITPVPSLGATDQHSQVQLFKEGPNDKLIIFIEVKDHQADLGIPTPEGELDFNYLKGASFESLLQAELHGTRASLTESSKPSVSVIVDKVNEFSLGELFMAFEISIAFLGEILKIDTFNQPGVERSKVLTREILLSEQKK